MWRISLDREKEIEQQMVEQVFSRNIYVTNKQIYVN